jgi:hypothetical protein
MARTLAEKFDKLREAMSPDAQARAKVRADEMLAEISPVRASDHRPLWLRQKGYGFHMGRPDPPSDVSPVRAIYWEHVRIMRRLQADPELIALAERVATEKDGPEPPPESPVRASEKCPDCNGTGTRLYAKEVSDGCDRCNATGVVESPVRASAPEQAVDAAYAECMRNLTPAEAKRWNEHDYSVRWKWRAILLALDAAAEARGRQQAEQGWQERDLKQMFSDGVDVARSYGDNAFHLWGPQLERQFQRAFERLKNGEAQNVQSLPAEARVQQAEQARDDSKSFAEYVRVRLSAHDYVEAQAKLERLASKVAALTQALKDYGTHDESCIVGQAGHPCTCGLDAALTGATK